MTSTASQVVNQMWLTTAASQVVNQIWLITWLFVYMYVQELDRKTDISERKKNLLADLSDYNISVSVMKYRAEFASVK